MRTKTTMSLCAVAALVLLNDAVNAQCNATNDNGLQTFAATDDPDKLFHEFGDAVDIFDDGLTSTIPTIVIGAPHTPGFQAEYGTGDAYTFDFVELNWANGFHLNSVLPGSITLEADDGFGQSVAVHGDTIAGI